MKKVLVTGVAGFLGSHLAKHHLEAGDQVLGIDDFCSSTQTSMHLKDLCGYETFSFVECDITKPIVNDHIGGWQYQRKGLDLIYNFACPASPPRYQEMPVHTMLTCVVGTERMLAAAELYDAVLVHASTSEVYGDPDRSPQPESYRGCVNSYGPRACYDEGKRAAEALCYDYLDSYSVDARMVRIFNTYGPNMDPYDGRVVSNFIRQALKREPLTVYGDGSQSRSFCYVDDLIRGIVALGALDHNPATPINLGNPNEFTILELANEVVKRLGGDLTRQSLPVDDPTQRCPDITKAKELLKWEPKVQLADGLDKTIAYFKGVVR
jgi:UDP-glucuronate decarboxylase